MKIIIDIKIYIIRMKMIIIIIIFIRTGINIEFARCRHDGVLMRVLKRYTHLEEYKTPCCLEEEWKHYVTLCPRK